MDAPDAAIERSMTLLEAAVLGVVQGVTEFLPVSSSGHLVLTRHAMGLTGDALLFDAVVHFGSLIAIMAVFRVEIAQMLGGLRPGGGEEARGGRQLLGLLALGTVPLVIVGLFFRHQVTAAFSNPAVVPWMLFVTALFLVVSERFRTTAPKELTRERAIMVGLWQMLAVLPGLSRSGATIAGGMLAGLDRERATRFSFLLAIPAILGVTILELSRALRTDGPEIANPMGLLMGTVASGFATWAAVVIFLRYVRGRSLLPFAAYCVLFGALMMLVRPW